jgi:hypothetical protein
MRLAGAGFYWSTVAALGKWMGQGGRAVNLQHLATEQFLDTPPMHPTHLL